MTAQWPQQFQPAQSQGFVGYSQQYAQQYAQHHGYAAQSNGAYPSSYPPDPQPAPVKQEAQPTPNSCYNCGSPEHWAQSCPEPRREVPVGEIYRHNFTRPPKRQKPNAPIITKYPVPPHVQQNMALQQQYYGAAPYNHSTYPSHQGHHFPPTPVSAQSPSQMQWQQPPHHQQYPNQYQQGGYYQQGNNYQNSYPTPISQTPSPFPNSYHANQQSHNQPPSSFNRNFKPATHQNVPPYGSQGQPFANASPSSAISPSNGYPAVQNHDAVRKSREALNQGAQSLNQPMQSHSAKPKSPPTEFTQSQPEEDNLNGLDIPDIPPSSTFLLDEVVLAGHTSFCLVKRPLPSNFVVADAIAPFEASRGEDQGRCESKYWPKGDFSKLYQHVKDSNDWVDVLNDPIFLTIPEESEIIPLEELTSLYNPIHSDDGNEETEDQIQEAVEDSKSLQDGGDTGDFMDSLEHALSEGRRKQSDQKCSNNNTPKEPAESQTNTEELLASLGVTGSPKPVRAPARPYPPPSQEQQSQVSSDHIRQPSSRSPSRQVAQDRHPKSSSGIKSEYHDHEENDKWKQTNPFNNRNTPHDNRLTTRTIPGSSERPYSHNFEQPPPPVPLVQKHSFSEGIGIRPLSADQNLGNHPLFADPISTNGTNYNKQSVLEHYSSPTKTQSERLNGRKREYDHRDSSDEGQAPGRRQADDFTPKLKRRQPKVAEAYSRRW